MVHAIAVFAPAAECEAIDRRDDRLAEVFR